MITIEQRHAILAMPNSEADDVEAARARLLEFFEAEDGNRLAADLLRAALDRRNGDEVELSLLLFFHFGVTAQDAELLNEALRDACHTRHEDVVLLMRQLGSPRSIEALRWAALNVPGYLEFEDGRSLKRKVTMALGVIPGDGSLAVLKELAQSRDPFLAKEANRQLTRRSTAS